MADLRYIGARYVPRFMGTYDSTQVYEGLDVVDDGNDVLYISKQPVPINTPPTHTTYWAEYGRIQNFQDQINAINEEIADMKDGTVTGSLQNQINSIGSDIDNKYLLTDCLEVNVVADGVKTYGDIFNELMLLLIAHGTAHSDLYYRITGLAVSGTALTSFEGASSHLYKGDSIPDTITAHGITVSSSHLIARSIVLSTTLANNRYRYYESEASPSVTVVTTDVPTSGTIRLRFDTYTKVE